MNILQISGTVHLEIPECGDSLAALKYFGVRHVSCRFGIFWIAAIPRAAFRSHRVSCRFCIFTERGTAERSEASTALAQATQVA